MPYRKMDSSYLPTIERIINLNGEVLVEHYIGRYVAKYYFLHSLDELKDLFKKMDTRDVITVYKKKQLPYRGILNNEFSKKVLENYNKEFHYAIYDYVVYPKDLESYGAGSNLSELNQDLKELLNDFGNDNLSLCFGADPRPIYSKISIMEDDEVIVISGE